MQKKKEEEEDEQNTKIYKKKQQTGDTDISGVPGLICLDVKSRNS